MLDKEQTESYELAKFRGITAAYVSAVEYLETLSPTETFHLRTGVEFIRDALAWYYTHNDNAPTLLQLYRAVLALYCQLLLPHLTSEQQILMEKYRDYTEG